MGRHPQSGYANADQYQRDIAEVRAVDDHSFTLHLGRPQCQYQQINDFVLLPAQLEEPVFTADPVQYRLKSHFETDTTNPALYNGPYRISAVVPGSAVTLERNASWAGPKAQFDKIVIKAIENTAALEANLLSGQIDMIAGEVGMSLEQVLALQQRQGDKYQFIFKPGLTYEHITLNLDQPQFKDVRVRQALLLALDRAQLVQKLFADRQPVARDNIHPLDRYYTDAVKTYGYDPAAAKNCWMKRGWVAGADGVRMKDGQRLAFTFSTTAGNRTRELVQQVVLAGWKAIGVAAQVKNEPPRVLFGQSLDHRQFDSSLFAWTSAPESAPRTNLHSEMIPAAGNGWAGQNFGGYHNMRMDQILDQLDKSCGEAEQKQLWTKMQQLYANDLPELPCFSKQKPMCCQKT